MWPDLLWAKQLCRTVLLRWKYKALPMGGRKPPSSVNRGLLPLSGNASVKSEVESHLRPGWGDTCEVISLLPVLFWNLCICAYGHTCAGAYRSSRAQPRVLSLRNHLPCVWRHETLSLAGTWRALILLDGRPVNPKDLPGLPGTALTTEPTPPPAPLVLVLSIGRNTVLPRCFLRVGFWWKRRSSRLTCQKRLVMLK